MKINDSTADTLTAVSGVMALAHRLSELQPIVSFIAACIAICSGVVAIWYYIKQARKS